METRIARGIQRSVEALAWCGQRLFSAGIYADVTEWNISTGTPKAQQDSHGGAVWCLAVSHANDRLAIGCEDGGVRLLNLAEEGLPLASRFEIQEGRVLSLAWSAADDMLVTGDANSTLRVYHVASGRPLSHIVLDAGARDKTLIWSVAFLSGMTVVSSDSLGRVQMWDGRHGTLECSLETHAADVHAMVATENAIFASGVDSKLVKLVRHPDKAHEWVVNGARRDHSHDVHALAMLPDGRIVSGGVDTKLLVYQPDGFETGRHLSHSYLAFPQRNICSLAPQARLLAAQLQDAVQLWQLASRSSKSKIGKVLKPTLDLTVKVPGKRHVVAAALSADGQYLAFSAATIGTRLLRLSKNDQGAMVPSRVAGTKVIGLAKDIVFVPNSAALVARVGAQSVKVFNLEEGKLAAELELPIADEEVVHLGYNTALAVSGDAQWVAAVTGNRVDIFSLDSLQWTWTWKMSKLITAAHFLPVEPHLVLVDVGRKIAIVDVEDHSAVPWTVQSEETGLPQQWLSNKSRVVAMHSCESRPHRLFVQELNGFHIIDVDKKPPPPNAALKVAKGKPANPAEDKTVPSWRFVTQYEPLMFMDCIDDREIVVVERPLRAIEDALPLPLARQRYGT